MDQQGLITLFLLLPLAAFSGWYLARKSYRNKRFNTSDKQGIPPEYLKGLNFVLNEQPDKAVEVFVKLLEVDSETVETHFALGKLFRQRGEVEKAVRIHQNLIARPNLSIDLRSQAQLELGIDYMRLGLLDRAEILFKELVDNNQCTEPALNGLLDIYQQEKDWGNTIIISRRLEQVSKADQSLIIAHYYCELAEQSLLKDDQQGVKDNIKRALNNNSKCARASLLDARVQMDRGKFKRAIRSFNRVIKQDPECIPVVLSPMAQCYRETGKLDDFRAYLQELVDTYGNISPMIYLTGLIEELEGKDMARAYLSKELKKRPTVRGVNKLLEYLISDDADNVPEEVKTVKILIENLLENNSIFKCNQCGFDAIKMHWYCPSCKSWDTIKPVHGVEGE